MRVLFDTIQANRELTDLAGTVGLTLRDLMYDQGRLLAQDAIRRVKPGGPQEGTAAQKKAGMQAISNDARRIIVPYDNGTGTTFLRDMAELGLSEQAYQFKSKTGAVYLVDKDHYRPSISLTELETFYNSQRSKKTGRVTKAGSFTRNIGRWKSIEKMHIPQRIAKKFIASKQKKVGQLKAGFVAAADYFAGLMNTTPKSIPSWVRKQAKKMGSSLNGVNRTTGVGFVEVINLVPYAENAIPQSLIAWLEGNRQRDITRNAKKRLKRVAADHNARYARAA